MYYIKKIFLTGNGVETSGVDLTPGLNIIYNRQKLERVI